jgi:hypothetical protein
MTTAHEYFYLLEALPQNVLLCAFGAFTGEAQLRQACRAQSSGHLPDDRYTLPSESPLEVSNACCDSPGSS